MSAQQELRLPGLPTRSPEEAQNYSNNLEAEKRFRLSQAEFGIFPAHEAETSKNGQSLLEEAAATYGFSMRILGEKEIAHNGHAAHYTAPEGTVIAEFKPIERPQLPLGSFHHLRAGIDLLRGQRLQQASEAEFQA